MRSTMARSAVYYRVCLLVLLLSPAMAITNTTSFLPTKYTSSPPRDAAYIWSSLVAGVGSGALASIVCAPLDLLRTRMQVWGEMSQKKISAMDFLKSIQQTEGAIGYFRGLGATLATVPLFWGIYFPLYDDFKHRFAHQCNFPPAATHCASAISAGAIADVVCNPLFFVRTRLQTEALHRTAGQPAHMGMMTTVKQLYQEGGVLIFWRGISASLFGLSHVAVQFPVYEYLKEHFRNGREHCTSMELLVASGVSKMFASLLTYPHEVLRSRMMDSRTSKTLLQTIERILTKEGYLGFYSGIHISLLRVVPNCCITFLSYELLLRLAKEKLQARTNNI